MDEIILSSDNTTPARQFEGDIGSIIELLWENIPFSNHTSTWRELNTNHFVFRCPIDLARAIGRYFDPSYVHVEEHPGENWATVWRTSFWIQSTYRTRKIEKEKQQQEEEKKHKEFKLNVTFARERRFKRMLAKIVGIGSLKGRLLRDVEKNFMMMIQLRYRDAGEEGVRAWIAEREESYKRKIYESPTEEETVKTDTAIQ